MVESKDYSAENDQDCYVVDGYFPCYGKCFDFCKTSAEIPYKSTCPMCNIWTSFPDSTSLEVITFFECKSNGYGKRIKEGKVYEK